MELVPYAPVVLLMAWFGSGIALFLVCSPATYSASGVRYTVGDSEIME